MPSAQHLRDAFGKCSVLVCPPLQKNPNQTNSLLQQQQDIDFPEGVQGRPRAAQGPAIKEILIKYRTKVSSVVKQQHREPEGLCQRSPWLWAEAWTKILQRCTRTPLTFPPPYFSFLSYNWQHHSAHLESKLRHRDPKGFPPGPAETRITFSLIPTSRRLHPTLSFPSTAFPPQGTSTLTQRSAL